MILIKLTPLEGGMVEAQPIGYHEAVRAQFKGVPGSHWDPDRRAYIAPIEAIEGVLATLQKAGVAKVSRTAEPVKVTSERVSLVTLPPALRPYQREGIEFLAKTLPKYGSGIIADEMGLGKTVQAILATPPGARTIVVCPAVVAGHWADEIEKWAGEASLIWTGKKKPKIAIGDAFASVKWLVLSYDMFRRMAPELPEADAVILDELHYLGDYKALRSKSVRAYLARCTRRPTLVGLTGTPITSWLQHLYNPLDLLFPNRFGSWFTFTQRYCTPAEAPIWMGDYSFKPISEVCVGDEIIGWSDTKSGGRGKRGAQKGTRQKKLTRAKVTAVHKTTAPVLEVTMTSGRKLRCTPDHLWLPYNSGASTGKRKKDGSRETWDWTRVVTPYGRMPTLSHVVDTPPELPINLQYTAGWLGGMCDGEGTGNFIAQDAQANPEVHTRIGEELAALGLPFTKGPLGYYLTGGKQVFKQHMVNFINWCKPTKRKTKTNDKLLLTAAFKKPDCVDHVRPLGVMPVYGLTTETGNYIAYGFASKNCSGRFEELVAKTGRPVLDAEGLPRRVWRADGVSNLDELRTRLAPLLLRRTKADSGIVLPPRIRSTIPVELPAAAQRELRALMAQLRTPDEMRRALVGVEAYKLDAAVELVNELVAGGSKVLLFTTRRKHAHDLGNRLHAPVVTGEDDPSTRRARLTAAPVAVATLLSVTTGIDLTHFDSAIFVGLDWVPANLLQAEARLHRPNQTKTVNIYYLIGKPSIDEQIRHVVVDRLETFTAVLGTGGATGEASLAKDLEDRSDLLKQIVQLVES